MSYIKDKVHQIRIPLELCRGSHCMGELTARRWEGRGEEVEGEMWPTQKNFGVTPPIV